MTVRYFAGARAAAGTGEETLPAAGTLGELVASVSTRHGDRLGAVLGAASFLVNGTACRDHDQEVPPGAVVDVLPPFAGG